MRFGLYLLVPLLAALFLLPDFEAEAKEDEPLLYKTQSKRGYCECAKGQGSWEFLRSPMRPPADPARCGLLLANGDCSGKPRPKGTPGGCWGSQKKECFFKRHAYSFGLSCSVCWEESKKCESCDKLIGGRDQKTRDMLKRQLEIEGGAGKKNPFVIVVSRHFYVVTDIHRKLKVKTKGGAPRVATAHEVAHLYAERAERAYTDFVHYFKGRVSLGKPMGIYLTRRHGTAEKFAEKYLGSANTDMLYGGGSTRIAGGFCGNGFVGSLQEQGNDDDLHAYVRHMIGHILFSCWIVVDGKERACPIWAFCGSAHFLSKLLYPHRDYCTFCSNETTAPTGSGKDWMKKARGLARRRLDPIETFFARESTGRMSYNDHVRAWSMMHMGLIEDNERWLEVLKQLRYKNDEGFAFKSAMNITSDDYHTRWVDRLTGKRKTMGEVKDDLEDPDAPGRRERKRILQTDDPKVLAGLVRGVDTVTDVKMAEVMVKRMDHESDLVRETIQWVLGRTSDDAVIQWLREEGLAHKNKMSRAGVARVLGRLGDPLSREPLEKLLDDPFWLTRANAAFALAMIHDEKSLRPLVKALDEKKPKAWMAIADAVAAYNTRDDEATLATVRYLSHGSWQLRVTAARALASYGTDKAMDALVKRFAMERGRLEQELLRALKAVSGDDLGEKPATWEAWWKKQKEKFGGFDPNQPPPPNPADDRYFDPKRDKPRPEEPDYYGRRIYSRSVGFVFDVSSSMDKNMEIPAGAVGKLGNIPKSGTRMEIAKQVLADTIVQLNSMVKFNLVFFSTEVRPWRGGKLVPAGGGNAEAAASAVKNAPADGETNIQGALKATLGLHGKSSLDANLDNIPDTVYFLTDGSPTRGEITSAPELLGWFENLNRFAKVRLHVVAFGNLGVDLDFLGKLAKVGGGEFIHVPER
ncbi:MAG: HEAT repeat domain-containing protein [Planctomycetota bacterium]|nr:HEAT repeat domain-containing protein [Planctomycetota bacterium]